MPEPYRIAMSVLSVVSTLVLSYAVTLNNHTVCAAALMGLVLLLERCEETGLTRLRAFMAGILTGLILNLEFVAGGVFGIAVFVFVLTAIAPHRIENALMYAAGAGLLILSEAGMNMMSYGSPLPLYLFTHKPAFTEKNYLSYAFNILFGFEGVFLYMPALLFAGFAWGSERMRRDRVFVYMMISTVASIILFSVGTSDYGGWCYGFRFLVPLEPLILLYAADAVLRRRKPLLTAVFAAALLWGAVTAAVGLYDPWCAGYEGSSTTAASVHQHVRNSFCANLFAWSFERDPESALSRFFYHRFYGPETARRYLFETYQNSKNIPMMRTMLRRIEQEESPL